MSMEARFYKNDRIYLMSPYTANHLEGKEKKELEHFRYLLAVRAAGTMISKGLLVFSPIAHSHPMAVECEMDGAYKTWAKLDQSFISCWATKGVVLKIDGWNKSDGVRDEAMRIKEAGMQVIGLSPADISNLVVE